MPGPDIRAARQPCGPTSVRPDIRPARQPCGPTNVRPDSRTRERLVSVAFAEPGDRRENRGLHHGPRMDDLRVVEPERLVAER